MLTIIPRNGQTWLICGGRYFARQEMFDSVMSLLCEKNGCPDRIVHGGATGADAMADAWGKRMAIDVIAMPADWATGRSAGPIRNQRMLEDHTPAVVVAFPGGKGTADMVRRAKEAKDCGAILDVVEIRPHAVRTYPQSR